MLDQKWPVGGRMIEISGRQTARIVGLLEMAETFCPNQWGQSLSYIGLGLHSKDSIVRSDAALLQRTEAIGIWMLRSLKTPFYWP